MILTDTDVARKNLLLLCFEYISITDKLSSYNFLDFDYKEKKCNKFTGN